MFYYLYLLLFDPENILRFLRIFKYITVRAGFSLFTSFFIGLIITKRIINLLKERDTLDRGREDVPEGHKSKVGTPTMGGVAIFIASMLGIFLWADLSNSFVLIALLTLFLSFLIGYADDYLKTFIDRGKGLKPLYKLILLVLLSVIIGVILLRFRNRFPITVISFPLLKNVNIDIGVFYLIVIALIIIGTSNAVNLTDGLDGLAAGCLIFGFFAMSIMAYVTGHLNFASYLNLNFISIAGELAVVCATIAGSILAFLWYNSHPAEIFMGDTGSICLGATLGTIAILIKQEIILILIGLIFVVETLSVILQVSSFQVLGRRIFKMSPIHHHYELKGIPESKIVIRFWIIALLACILALALLKLR